jgi:hypothetical protein
MENKAIISSCPISKPQLSPAQLGKPFTATLILAIH